jgi:hypothetical protein
MEETELAVLDDPNWKNKILMLGGALGLMAGLGVAYLMVQRAEREGSKPNMNMGEGLKLGLLVLGMLRQVSQLGEGK